MHNDAWPAITPWEPTKRSLHRYAQMLGKVRLALSPYQPNFLFTGLALTARGFTTGIMPSGTRTVAVSLDVGDAAIIIETSDGAARRVSLAPPCTIARVFGELHAALAALDIPVVISPIPQEVPDVTPFDTDEAPAVFETLDAMRWFTVITAIHGVFDRWRAHFAGRIGLQLWWGAFDYSMMLFNGRKVDAPTDRGYLLKYDLDAELINVGFYLGDEPVFYGYIYPQPPACDALPIDPPGAVWSAQLGEWILPYEAVRTSADPARTLGAFLDAIYHLSDHAAGWDHRALTYVPPPLRRAKHR